MFYAYLYRDPSRNNEPIYVGKGSGRRAHRHLNRTDMHPFIQRLQFMTKNNVQPNISFLYEGDDEELAFFVEVEAIDLYGRKDLGKGSLLNLTDGGEGPVGRKLTDEQRFKSGNAMRGKKRSAESIARQRLTLATPESKTRQRVASAAIAADPAVKAAKSLATARSHINGGHAKKRELKCL